MRGDYLLEIGSDEIPARYLPGAVEDLKERAREAFRSARLRFEDIETYGTPRRLVLYVRGLEDMSEDAVSRVRGPSKKAAYDGDGNPTKALLGFCRSLGIETSQVTLEGEAGAEYVYGEKHEKGRPVQEVLPEIIPGVVLGIECPHPMRWGDGNWRWFRPIRWVVSLYDREVVPLTVAGKAAGRVTYGHRVLHPKETYVPSAQEYFQVASSIFVEVDGAKRKDRILSEAGRLAASVGGRPVVDEELLSEVASICEHPSPFIGRFDERYLSLPKEVLMTSMKHHQRYFPVVGEDGALRPAFIGVRDGDPEAGIETVRKGNEWVLRARLEDASFFFEQDLKVPLVDLVPRLEGVRFIKNAGSMRDKAARMEEIAGYLAEALGLPDEEARAAREAALLAKADLLTAMVGEFPELEGIMGGRYAAIQGMEPLVAKAIAEHYMPKGARDSIPSRGAPAVVALSDKLDTLAVSFSLGIEVSGSQDPLGLRRNALGVVAIVMGHGYDLTMEDLVGLPLKLATGVVSEPSPDARSRLEAFLKARVETVIHERGFPIEVVRAVLSGDETRIARAEGMARALADLAGTKDLADLVTGWRRVGVLGKGGAGREVDEALLKEEAEAALYRALRSWEGALKRALESRDYAGYLRILVELKPYIDRCLDEVLIMTDDAALRENRLALLGSVAAYWNAYADFSLLKSLVPSG
ncbi:MAG TPA: glycine--tRNA ligase subunit beta [Firmicutes bacterium]|nr:glycine--tRNA ligase subunit beta [Candidatus Fermentithermobacillaceae bacterium]